MSFARMLTQTVTLVAPGEKTDEYNNTVPDWSTATRVDVPGLIQQSGSTEDQADRDTVTSTHNLFLLPSAVITAQHKVEEGDRAFEVVDQPDYVRTTRGPHHVEVRLNQVAG